MNMDIELKRYLDSLEFVAEGESIWIPGELEFDLRLAFTTQYPPEKYTSSIRAVLLNQANAMMVVETPSETHILPGGRREAGETYEQTLHREIGEETGYRILNAEFIGVLHFVHRFPMTKDWNPVLYPHMVHPIYCAVAGEYDATLLEEDGPETGIGFFSLTELEAFSLDKAQYTIARHVLSL
ncbi:MAG: NUDIX hydrolase [Pseudomonadota bacterium]